MEEITLRGAVHHRVEDGDMLVFRVPNHYQYDDTVDIQQQLEQLRIELKEKHGKTVYFLVIKEEVRIDQYKLDSTGRGGRD